MTKSNQTSGQIISNHPQISTGNEQNLGDTPRSTASSVRPGLYEILVIPWCFSPPRNGNRNQTSLTDLGETNPCFCNRNGLFYGNMDISEILDGHGLGDIFVIKHVIKPTAKF